MAKRKPKGPRPSGGLESEVLACLAAADGALTPGEVQAELGGDLAYTTVMTTLSRLHAKQALTRVPRGRAYAYEMIGGTDGALAGVTAHQMQKLLDADANPATVLSRFVEGLDSDTERTLRKLLDAHAPKKAARTTAKAPAKTVARTTSARRRSS